jgi:thioredoxin 1
MNQITQDQFQKEVLESDKPSIVDLWAPWCQPCLILNPILTDLHQEYGSKVNFISVNIELYPSIAKDYSVSAIPTLLFFKDKQLVSRSIGVVTKGKIKEYLNTLIEQ